MRWSCLRKLFVIVRSSGDFCKRNIDTFFERVSATDVRMNCTYFVAQLSSFLGIDPFRVKVLCQRLFVSYDMVSGRWTRLRNRGCAPRTDGCARACVPLTSDEQRSCGRARHAVRVSVSVLL
jgi:hypothetical protein